MSFGNAIDLMGVFSENPMDVNDLRTLLALGPQMGTRVFFNNDRAVVKNWTIGALEVLGDFKEFLNDFIHEQSLKVELNPNVRQGRLDALSSLNVLLS